MRNVLLVTNELYPHHRGGIGRMMFNFASFVQGSHWGSGVRLHFLMDPLRVPDLHSVADHYADEGLGAVWSYPPRVTQISTLESGLFRAVDPNAYSAERFVSDSIRCLEGIMAAQDELGADFDVVEFPDFGALGYAAIAAKLTGEALANTILAVRLHSSSAIIHASEPGYHYLGPDERALSELERVCLRDADMVVGHLPVILRENQRFYGFSEEWADRAILEFPPTGLTGAELGVVPADLGDGPHFLFSSRLQPFKRPDLFVAAAVEHLQRYPDSEALFTIASYGWDGKYIDGLAAAIPANFRHRIRFVMDPDPLLRDALLAGAIVVIPSDYESLCLFAYESHLRGCTLVLNRRCAAFGDVDFWGNAPDVHFFEGTTVSLAQVFGELASNWAKARECPEDAHSKSRQLPSPSLYFLHALSQSPHSRATGDEAGPGPSSEKIAIVAEVDRREWGLGLSGSVWNPAFQGEYECSVLLLGPTPRDVDPAKSLPPHVRLLPGWQIPWDELRRAILESSPDFILFVPKGLAVGEEFLTQALRVLKAKADVVLVTTHVARLSEAAVRDGWQSQDRDEYVHGSFLYTVLAGSPSIKTGQLHQLDGPILMRARWALEAWPDARGPSMLIDGAQSMIREGVEAFPLARVWAWEQESWSVKH